MVALSAVLGGIAAVPSVVTGISSIFDIFGGGARAPIPATQVAVGGPGFPGAGAG